MKLALLATIATAAQVPEPSLHHGWSKSTIPAAQLTDSIRFTVSAKEQNIDALKGFVLEVSNPKSAIYGDFMTTSQVLDFTAPASKHLTDIEAWVRSEPACAHTLKNGRDFEITCPLAAAEALLRTRFHVIKHPNHPASPLVRAKGFSLPEAVESARSAVWGLHGLPRPVQSSLVSADPTEPAKVTPDVIASTYGISGVKPAGGNVNRMAVAEFQGQFEKDADLAQFFKSYVSSAQPGDEKVSKFVGDQDEQQAGVEASLDIQYEMGVAPHVKAEFWLFKGMDFCLDLANYTATILADKQPSLVHSISYGWQGNLTQLQCTMAKQKVVNDNFVKIGATGVSIIFASGDSGSGYAPSNQCGSSQAADTVNTGVVESHFANIPEAQICCEQARGKDWSFVPSNSSTPGAKCTADDSGTKDTEWVGTPEFKAKVPTHEECCHFATEIGDTGKFSFFNQTCTIWGTTTGTKTTPGAWGGQAAKQSKGDCYIFSSVNGTKPAKGSISGKKTKSQVVLWPSWPASSPWITAVGATRFVGQQVGNEEMATDQFGSGGGFSTRFAQSPDATWQTAAVKQYTSNPPKDSHYPPAGSFPVTGRATPDISALGEGYQVVTNGEVQSVGGTSASTPAFAGMVALLNEARIQAGKKQLGFLNPFIYQNAEAFKDVTKGTNAIGRGTGPIAYGFNCTKGWDPATGLGTPIFSKLMAAAMKA